MASDTSIKFYGMWHLVGKTVQACIGGLDCGDYTVASDGTIVVPFGSDDQGLMTPQYLVAIGNADAESGAQITFYADDVLTTLTVPAVIGQRYDSYGQTLRPILPNDLRLQVIGLGKIRRSHQYAALFHNVVKIFVGTTADVVERASLTLPDGENAYPQTITYTGVHRGLLTDNYGYDSMVLWNVSRPVPAAVCAISSFLVASEE